MVSYEDALSRDESVLILMKHCQDMKQQETRFRLISLLLVLSCTALFMYTTGSALRQQGDSGASGLKNPAEQSFASSKQDRACPPDKKSSDEQTNFTRLPIHLVSTQNNKTDGQYIKWRPMVGEDHNMQSAIVIPEQGLYFIYVRFALGCPDDDTDSTSLDARLHCWNEGYDEIRPLMTVRDGLRCPPEDLFNVTNRSVFVGQIFELMKGDHVRVWIEQGLKLITRSEFGAYLT